MKEDELRRVVEYVVKHFCCAACKECGSDPENVLKWVKEVVQLAPDKSELEKPLENVPQGNCSGLKK